MHRLISLLAIPLLSAGTLAAQSLKGRVLDAGSDQPVRGVLIELRAARGQPLGTAVTDSAGVFRFALPQPGLFRLHAARIGYQPVLSTGFEVAAQEAVELDLHISAAALLMNPLTITSRPEPARSRYLERMGFYEREERSSGSFMRRERVDRSNAAHLSQLLTEMPGVWRMTRNGVPLVTFNRQRPCSPQVVLDGMPMLEPGRIDDIIAVRAIEAIEVYRGPAESPAEFGGSERGCGTLVIWTRDRV